MTAETITLPRPRFSAVIQSLRKQAKNPPYGSSALTTCILKIPHVILALRAGIPPLVCTGNANVLPCPSLGDPRFARMTVETITLRVHGVVPPSPSSEDSTGCWRTPLNDGSF